MSEILWGKDSAFTLSRYKISEYLKILKIEAIPETP